MADRPALSKATLKNAEIIYAEFYFSVHGHACERDIWVAAFDAWKAGSQDLTMVNAAISAAQAIETGTLRTTPTH